ncbi:rho GTPase-activating protein SYDE1 isoform X2 [Phyllopteryx taeniolatus]|uniref:rho GTPase-activating protein SYDE1 isoform X2 n=1 Tax=Phyllopteryx taeniolatus TaxID=161469 RepID=UPI002AD5B227|nr:rho GTPase-activating protein SYDE1 isoform X2 [Phyllopteryx taeniolatus]
MAQPLLKRTFSRLRGKNRSRRKTEPQVNVHSDVILHNSCPPLPAMTSKSRKAEADPAPPSPIHLTKSQQWVWPGSEAPPTSQNSDADRNSEAPKLIRDKVASQPAGGSTKTSTTISSKLSGKRAYLKSLDRSSRDWVLSSGKSDTSDEACGRWRESGSDIWYNPIPEEEEDPAGQGRPRRELRPGRAESRTQQSHACKEGPSPEAISRHVDQFTAESSDFHPAFPKKGGVIDRLRSPGTVRKLSLKMRKLPELTRKLSLRSSRVGQGSDRVAGGDESTNKNGSNHNVISRYHLDSSAPRALPLRRSSRVRSASKGGQGGYLSDGDSPELLPRQSGDLASFPLYVGSELSRCGQRITGLLTVHLVGLDQMKTKKSDESKEIFLAIQIDGITRARTSLLNLQGHTVALNHTFHLELERARQLRVVVLTSAQPKLDRIRNRVCCLGGVTIPPLFKGSRSQQLCVKLEPRGLLYIKVSLQEQWDMQFGSNSTASANVFGVELRHLVEEEGSASAVPLLIQKTVAEIERRGLKAVGLYRLCGSAAVKKELRDWFERNSSAVRLGEDLYPDINVITGTLKDYLRELPSSLITATLYEVVNEAMTRRPPPISTVSPDPQLSENTVELLSCLPPPERATLTLLLDHLSLVAHFSSCNRMTHQNLAVCFGPVLLKQTQEGWRGDGAKGGQKGGKALSQGEDSASAVDFKRHIEALHYLLQLWPVPTDRIPADDSAEVSSPSSTIVTYKSPDHPVLEEEEEEEEEEEAEAVVSRRGRDGVARLDSPPPVNRYAGDWSICGQHLPSGQEADYDEVAGSESDQGSEDDEEKKEAWFPGGSRALYAEDVMDFDAPFNCQLSLKDFDSLIHDLDRELGKRINICM